MPIITPKRYRPLSMKQNSPKGRAPTYMWATLGRGIPRSDDVLRIRLLEGTYAVSLPLDIIISQLAATNWNVIPEEEYEDSPAHQEAAEEIIKFLDGRYNHNEESWNAIQERYARDLVSIGTGIIEKVRDPAKDCTVELYARDGGLFTKDMDDHGLLPAPGARDKNGKPVPAYWEWGAAQAYGSMYRFGDSQYMFEFEAHNSPYIYKYTGSAPTPFDRNELLWSDYNWRSWDVYGKGKVATAMQLVEVVLNMVLINKAEFSQTETPEGLLNLVGAGPDEFAAFQNYWKAEIKGEMHKTAMLATPDPIQWLPFRGSRKELQYLDSCKWFTKLIWMLFGLNANEVGDLAEGKGSMGTSGAATRQASVDVWRKTTMPLLSLMEADINRQLIPDLEPYKRVGGGLRFRYSITHPDAEDQMRARQGADLELGLLTLNEALQEQGKEVVPWGNMPLKLYNTLIDRHSEWFFENFINMENKPEPPEPGGGGGLFGLREIPTAPKHFSPPMTRNAEAVDEMTDLELEHFDGHEGLFRVGRSMAKELEKAIKKELKSFIASLSDFWPAKSITREIVPLAPMGEILRRIGLAPVMQDIISGRYAEVLRMKFEEDSAELDARLSEITDGEMSFTVPEVREDSIALQIMRRRAELQAIAVEADIRDQIGTVLREAADRNMSVRELTDALDDRVPEISHAKSRLIARTEVMSSQRGASQVLAESSSLIAGKMWSSTHDNRTREWHRVMDGTIVDKAASFTVPGGFGGQPKDYPKDTYIVGGDQPYNCRCRQKLILAEDMPQ